MCTLVPLAWSDCWTSQGQLGPNQVPWGLPKPVVEGEPAAEELLLGRPGHTSAGPWKGWATVARTVVREEGDPRPSVRAASPGPERLLATSQDRARLRGSWAAVLVGEPSAEEMHHLLYDLGITDGKAAKGTIRLPAPHQSQIRSRGSCTG